MKYSTMKNENYDMCVAEPNNSWGGDWTEKKLNAFEKYVQAYLTIMNKNRTKWGWELVYFDGFAGCGARTVPETEESCMSSLTFEDDIAAGYDAQTSYKGAAERVMQINMHNFDYLLFMDKNPKACEQLKERLTPLKKDYQRFDCRTGDANEGLIAVAQYLHEYPKTKALIMLDPFGMQIKWDSLEMLKGLNGVDLWLLLPSGVIVNRLLKKDGTLKYPEKLKSFFGLPEEKIMESFYEKDSQLSIFGEEQNYLKKTDSIRRISQLYIERLQTIFPCVPKNPLVLCNNNNTPIFHFIFASYNKVASKIAKDIIASC